MSRGVVEAFGPDGSSLGQRPVPDDHGYNLYLTDIFDGALISRFTLTSTVDAFRVDAAHWVPATCAE